MMQEYWPRHPKDASRYAILRAVIKVARHYNLAPAKCKGMTLRAVLNTVYDLADFEAIALDTWTDASLDTGI